LYFLTIIEKLRMINFTPEDLLEYHYGEMPPSNAALLEKMLEEDWALNQKRMVIAEAAARLDKSMYSPRQVVLDSILDYASQKTAVHPIY
jgi:hypothetical protein